MRWLNNANLPTGAQLNEMWRNPTASVISFDQSKTWTLSTQAMAPLVQNEVYALVNGIGRIAPLALSAQSAKPVLVATILGKPWRDGNDIVMSVSVRNNGTVLAPMVGIGGTLTATAPLTGFTTTGTVFGISVGTLAPGQATTVTLRFPPGITGTGSWPVRAPGSVRFALSSGYPGSETGGNLGNGQRLILP